MPQVILDCDNTFGLAGHDIDDGLALAHLLRMPTVDVLGVTLTYGNGTLAQVTQQTKLLWEAADLELPFYVGASSEVDVTSAAVRYLVKIVRQHPQEITIVATGSLTNLAAAQQLWPGFLKQVKQLYIMGGAFGPMTMGQQVVDELNFSVNDTAVKTVLSAAERPIIVSGSYIHDFVTFWPDQPTNWLAEQIQNWQVYNEKQWQLAGFINWDGMTATSLTQPDLFTWRDETVELNATALEKGLLIPKATGTCQLKLVTGIQNPAALTASLLADMHFLTAQAEG
ncbi:nucleoside hydrolase [Loigolactobacillus bifermentans]|uniref:Nucleoside hydrolase, IUNH family protein n=1 Tax=Loigolactobacillus bifermentans DSM 20003 TaxID=1423726 RepID=A0A0R1GND4_9LACO|nr:nucleoside hydrolase [Loigolactobacillus bifermentans]KRK32834.1 nucleoside hydrolase, IUNH family protein [Loigolactobacillus bifermentans DSM 20003]